MRFDVLRRSHFAIALTNWWRCGVFSCKLSRLLAAAAVRPSIEAWRTECDHRRGVAVYLGTGRSSGDVEIVDRTLPVGPRQAGWMLPGGRSLYVIESPADAAALSLLNERKTETGKAAGD